MSTALYAYQQVGLLLSYAPIVDQTFAVEAINKPLAQHKLVHKNNRAKQYITHYTTIT